jgi:glutamate carboxypeptidase
MKRFLPFAIATLVSFISVSQKLTKKEQEIIKKVEANHTSAIDLLARSVNMNSGTFNISGVKANGDLLEPEFRKIGFETRWIDMPVEMKRAGHLFAERKGTKGKRVLLIGHLDTVFEPDSPFQSWTANDSVASGPGANDMKGGNIILLYALKALHDAGVLKDTQIIVALHGDEENGGDPESISRRDIIEAAKRSDLALAFETATAFSYATVARRGASGWKLVTTGKRAHSSGVFSKNTGSGAIYEAARILNRFHNELQEQYLTFNPGMITGGATAVQKAGNGTASGKSNIVAETAIVTGDLRFISEEQKIRAREKMKAIVADHLPHTSATITFEDGIPAMFPSEGNYALLEKLSQVSKDMGLGEVKAWDPGQRGAGDISYVAPYIRGLDGLGAMGDGAHSLSETMNLKTFKDLTARAAVLIYRLTNSQE